MRSRSWTIGLAVAVGLAGIPGGAAAQQDSGSVGWYFAMHGVVSSLRGGSTTQTGVGSMGYGLDFAGGGTLGYLHAGADLGYLWVSDKRQFTNNTTGGEKSSNTEAFSAALVAGLHTGPLGSSKTMATILGVNAGYGWLSGERGISNCVDCDTEGLSFSVGSFVEPFVAIGSRDGAGIHVAGRIYSSGSDLQYTLLIGLMGGKLFR